MDNTIKLIKPKKTGEGTECDALECVNELYDFLQKKIKINKYKAWDVIYFLQEYLPLFPDCIEQCCICDSLFDSDSSGFYSNVEGAHYCEYCEYEAESGYCDHCSEVIYKSDNAAAEDDNCSDFLCKECYEEWKKL